MKISVEDIEKVARLSRLTLSEEEKKEMLRELNNFLSYAKRLTELDMTGIEPASHVIPVHNVFREDEVKPSMERDTLLKNAPDKEDGAFKVPKVIE
jgi:aspartyl-tRNA(Asn)/glutamyl-tRNA(Gln) amidotransferase subunit C